jgi:hypothetical protein
MSERGILAFTLGLEAGGFLGPIGQATGAAQAFLTTMLGIGGAVEGFKAAIERGAGLEQLSKRTGESVSTLYSLQKGFEGAGLSGDDVSQALFKMEQSLGGVNELGERTDDIFRRLGLNLNQLRHENSATAMQQILGSFGVLNQSGAASASMSIFGRGAGAEMVQLSRSSKEFADGMQHAAGAAQTFGRNAAQFDQLKRTFDELKDKGMELFAGLAEAITPMVQKFADDFNGIDFSALGNNLATVIEGFAQSWADGTISELIATAITDGLQAGFTAGIPMVKLFFDTAALSAIQTFNHLQAWIIGAVGSHLPATIRSRLGEFWSNKMASDNDFAAGVIKGDKAWMHTGFKSAFGDLDPLWLELKDKAATFRALHPGAAMTQGMMGGLDGKDVNPASGYRQEFTPLEHMGFVMSGLNNPLNSPQQETARNTAKTVRLLENIAAVFGQYQKINGGYPFGQLNAPL